MNTNTLMDSFNLTLGENGEAAFKSTGSNNLDLFGTINRDVSVLTLVTKFKNAWNENPEIAIKVLLNFRDIRGGKGEKRIGRILMFLIKLVFPDVYSKLLHYFVNIGCWKDILYIVEITHHYYEKLKSDTGINIPLQVNDTEANFFAEQLKLDIISKTPSLCAKWAPSEGCHYDKQTKIANKIMINMGLDCKSYRKMLTNLRSKIKLVETQLSQNKLSEINFGNLPSVAHKLYESAFIRSRNAKYIYKPERANLGRRYAKYLEDLSNGKEKANFKGIAPHELISNICKLNSNSDSNSHILMENQWESIRQNIEALEIFDYCISIIDVSASMTTGNPKPINVAVALGLLVSECAKGPFKDRVITFSDDPEFINLSDCSTLYSKVEKVKKANWGYSTNLEAVFDKILEIGDFFNLVQSKMPKKLFIFTDMQFNQVSGNKITTFDKINDKFNKRGYIMPQIICWNLRTVGTVSFTIYDKNVCLLSGFSTELMKAFLTTDEITPMSVFFSVIDQYEIPKMTLKMLSTRNVDIDTIEHAAIKSQFL